MGNRPVNAFSSATIKDQQAPARPPTPLPHCLNTNNYHPVSVCCQFCKNSAHCNCEAVGDEMKIKHIVSIFHVPITPCPSLRGRCRPNSSSHLSRTMAMHVNDFICSANYGQGNRITERLAVHPHNKSNLNASAVALSQTQMTMMIVIFCCKDNDVVLCCGREETEQNRTEPH